MASQRWHPMEHESRSCLTKMRYKSAVAAGKAKEAIRRQHRSGPSADCLNVYRCQYCSGYHLGRPQKKRTLKNRAAQRVAWQEEASAPEPHNFRAY